MNNDTPNQEISQELKPLTPAEQRKQQEAELKAFMQQFEQFHPRPHTDAENIMFSGSGAAEKALLWTIKNLPLLLLIALVSVIILAGDKTGSVFASTHLILPWQLWQSSIPTY